MNNVTLTDMNGIVLYRRNKPITNEEYIRTCSTKELAEEIYRLVWLENELFHRLELVEDFGRKKDLEIVTEWLKEKHQ